MEDCALIVQESLNAVKISDLMKLMGSKVQVQKESVDQKIKSYEDQLPAPTAAPTEAQCLWAADLYNKISSGYLPSQSEIQQFASIAKAKKTFR